MKLMAKFIMLATKEEPLQIKSVVAPEGVKGYIYIEAYKQAHVKTAIEGIGNLRMGLYNQQASAGSGVGAGLGLVLFLSGRRCRVASDLVLLVNMRRDDDSDSDDESR